MSSAIAINPKTRASSAQDSFTRLSATYKAVNRRMSIGAVTSSYSTTSVSGAVSVGGLVGHRYFAEIRNSFWNTQTSGQATSDGGTGKTTAEMKAISSFTETVMDGLDEPWDIVPVSLGETNSVYTWNIVDGQTYPFLSWQQVP